MNVPILSKRRAEARKRAEEAREAELQKLHDHIDRATQTIEARVGEIEQSMTSFVTELCEQLSESETTDG